MACPIGKDVRSWSENGWGSHHPGAHGHRRFAPAGPVGRDVRGRGPTRRRRTPRWPPPGAVGEQPGEAPGVVSIVRKACPRVERESVQATDLYLPRSTARIVSDFIASSSVGWGDHPHANTHGLHRVVRPPEVTAMGDAESPEPRPPRPAGIPRWLAIALAPVVGLVAFRAVHAGIAWALSHLGPRQGWADGGPAGWNLLGYAPVVVGAVLFLWVMVFGFTQYRNLPERVPVDWSPAFLMTGGPYAVSRHPM